MKPQIWIKSLLKERGHKLKDAAALLGTTPPRISDIIKGIRDVQSHEILALSKLLGISVTTLLRSLETGNYLKADDVDQNYLNILGRLTGSGKVLPVEDDFHTNRIALPTDVETSEGLYCYVMEDDSMAKEITPGSIVIAADPRKHFYPMVPGSIFLIKRPSNKLLLRKYHTSEDGTKWLIPLPETPNPDFQIYKLNFDTTTLNAPNPQPASVSNHTSDHASEYVNIDDILAAVLWVQKRYTPGTQ